MGERNVQRVVVVNDRHMVADEQLGSQLMGSFVRKLCQEERRPDAVVFYGSGVFLLAENSPVLDALETLSDLGVDLIGCGTCAGYYGIKNKIEIGRISDMRELVSVLMAAESVVTL
ncbi:MAG: sulfurtransferase-like selenium metabolism protein YedF [Candidatus Eisenbacteria bacterium]|nr:sulfurtransferase-like selenium metabolism protein YedF [Candidatus Eisenbacteria bacterium]